MKRFRRLLFFVPPWLFTAGSLAQDRFVHIDFGKCASVTNLAAGEIEKLGQLKWYFAHASVGENMMEGIADLNKADGRVFPVRAASADSRPPATTQPGIIYEENRGNPGWKSKLDKFHDAIAHGWKFPAVDVAMNKLCYIDQLASAPYYINSMTNLESISPKTTLVYMTMPLTTAADADNYLRNGFNTRVREWCRSRGRVLFDIADIEAHAATGVPCEFKHHGKICQCLCGDYTTDGGHLNAQGRQLVAKGFYALGAALVAKPVQLAD